MTTYTVTERGGCRIVTGNLPMRSMAMLLHGFPEGAVMDSDLARMLDAALVVGMPEDLANLKNDPNILAQARHRAAIGIKGLSRDALEWLATGHRGASSESMVHRFTGLSTLKPGAYPSDPADLRRCRLLLEQVPEFLPMLPLMADVSPAWAGLVKNWTALCDRMDAESPRWREGEGTAPETFRLMRLALKPESNEEDQPHANKP